MRKLKRFYAMAMASCMAITGFSVPASAEENGKSGDISYDGYDLVWSEEFDGSSVNRDDWNVELHEKGWVNSELQEYVDSDQNIKVEDGNLVITPIKKVETITTAGGEEQFTNTDFSEGMSGWTSTEASWSPAEFTYAAANGTVTYDIDNVGDADWCVQFKKENIALKAGTTYHVSYNIKSTVERPVFSGVMTATYTPYGEVTPTVGTDGTKVEFDFTPAADDDTAVFYITMGKVKGLADTIGAHTIEISDLSMTTVVKEEKFTNTDFSDGMSGWTSTEASWSPAEFTYAAAKGAVTYDIENVGDADWCVQFKKENVALEAGKTYHVSYNITSTVERPVVSGMMTAAYTPYKEVTPTVGPEGTKVSFDFTPAADDDTAVFYITMGKVKGLDEEIGAHTITISDLSMTTASAAKPTVKEKTSYTSGRISTQGKQEFTYGLFEARAKVPEGAGFLPAFWLMAGDENVYGQWPRCGEIDCMEVMGQDTQKLYGTIHYGNPHSESQGTHILTGDDSYADDFHTYSCEWEPGSIKWYVDGILFHEEHDWYSTTEGQGTLTYPAPFDQPFYIILNLAVGGSWVGNPDANTFDANNDYVVDYVRVYQKPEYDENVTRPEKEFVEREPNADGNFINNGTFAVAENLTDDVDWKFLNALEGEATATIENNQLTIETTNAGTVDYSVQLVQANIPFVKGATYEVSFDASASENREMNVDVKAPDRGYAAYMPTFIPALTTETKTYTTQFVMKSDSDPNGRLEFNMGAGSTADIHLSNVVVRKIADPDPNAKDEKTVLANGNYIYNGNFQEGTNHLGYWEIAAEDASVSVSGFSDGRRLVTTGGVVTISQDDLTFKPGMPFTFSFDAKAEKDAKITVTVGGNEYPVELNADGAKHEYSFAIPSTTGFADQSVAIKIEGAVSLDNVSMKEAALIKNGSFNDGITGFTVYVDSSAKASYVVDSLKEDNALSVTVNNTSDQDWKIQIKQENVKLEKGKTYKLTFDAKSTLERDIRVIMQGQEARGWSVYSNDNIVALTNEFKTFEDTFTMEEETDPAAFLSVCLGNVTEEIDTLHTVVIDNITLEEVETEEPELPDGVARLEGAVLSLKDVIGINLYTTLSESFVADEGAYVSVTSSNGTEKKIPVADAVEKTVNGNVYSVFTADVAAKEMTDTLVIKFVMSDGTETDPIEYSVVNYAAQILNNQDDAANAKAAPLVKAMLNYGAASQLYLGYNTDKLANESLSDEDKVVPPVEDLSEYAITAPEAMDGIAYKGISLVLKSEVRLRVYFTSDTALTADDYSVVLNGVEVDKSRLIAASSASGEYVEIVGINPADYSKKMSIKANGLTVEGVSVYSYINTAMNSSKTKQTLKDALTALYWYGVAAEAYSTGK